MRPGRRVRVVTVRHRRIAKIGPGVLAAVLTFQPLPAEAQQQGALVFGSDDSRTGVQIFEGSCARCHGGDGAGGASGAPANDFAFQNKMCVEMDR